MFYYLYKAFLNVIEDARIEKKIKRKYPGLRRCYIKGFAEIMKMKLFGIDSFDELDAFIDRINVFTKSSYTAAIDFNDEEQVIIDQIQNLESWDDVIAMTDKLWDKAVEEFEDNEFDMNGLPQDNFSSDDYEVEEVETSDDSDSGAINSDNSIDSILVPGGKIVVIFSLIKFSSEVIKIEKNNTVNIFNLNITYPLG